MSGPYRPTAPGLIALDPRGAQSDLILERRLRQPPGVVWRALSEPDQLVQWAPFSFDRHVGAGQRTDAEMIAADGRTRMPVLVRAAPPRLLSYLWGDDLLTWSLMPDGTGTRLILRHTVRDTTRLSSFSAGWHICLDVLERLVIGDPVGRIVGEDAYRNGWHDLKVAYEAQIDARPGLRPGR